MSTAKGTPTDRLWTAFVPRRSVLRRRSDRVETVARWVAVLLLVTSLPILLALGSGRAQHVRDEAAVARATSHEVTATITRVVPRATTAGATPTGAVDVTATWTAPDGTARTVTGVELRGARVGDPWSAWVDAADHQVRPPRTDAQASAEGVMTALWGLVAVGTGLVGLLAALHRVLDRRRMADWDEDWALFGLGRGRGVAG
jgi:hypothetical protein